MSGKRERLSRRGSKGGAKTSKNLKRTLILLILIIAAAIFYELYSDRLPEEKRPPEVRRSIPRQRSETQRIEPRGPLPGEISPPVAKPPGTEAPLPPPAKTPLVTPLPPTQVSGLRIAILIDDIGADLSPVKNLLQIDAPISFAILPHTPRSVTAAEIIHKAGRDILLHLPMEPRNYPTEKPGPGALLTTMDDAQLRQVLSEDLAAVPHISGVNNHMGSRFTEDEEKLTLVMKELKKRGLFFVDSRTSPQSKAERVSQEIGIPFASRRIFIDNGQDYAKTCQILLDVLNSAKGGNHTLLLIGHPYPNTVAALAKIVPELKSRGVEMVPVSRMIQ